MSRTGLLSGWKPFVIAIAVSVALFGAAALSLRYITEAITESKHGFYGQYGADKWVLSLLPNQPSRFFLDIGAYDGKFMSNSRLLEENGWHGICADPFPHNFNSRSCKVVAQPVGPTSGVRESMADCSEGLRGFLRPGQAMLSGIKRYTKIFEGQVADCPEKDMYTIGIADLLAAGNAPAIIDYVNLDTEGAELHILQGFPFDRHCVRTWTIEHNCEEPKQTKIRELLLSRGCRVEQVEVDWWAVCPCGDEEHPSLGAMKGKRLDSVQERDMKQSTSYAFEQAFHSQKYMDFFPYRHTWTGRFGACIKPVYTKAPGD